VSLATCQLHLPLISSFLPFSPPRSKSLFLSSFRIVTITVRKAFEKRLPRVRQSGLWRQSPDSLQCLPVVVPERRCQRHYSGQSRRRSQPSSSNFARRTGRSPNTLLFLLRHSSRPQGTYPVRKGRDHRPWRRPWPPTAPPRGSSCLRRRRRPLPSSTLPRSRTIQGTVSRQPTRVSHQACVEWTAHLHNPFSYPSFPLNVLTQ